VHALGPLDNELGVVAVTPAPKKMRLSISEFINSIAKQRNRTVQVLNILLFQTLIPRPSALHWFR
jgi:hypothetical protein